MSSRSPVVAWGAAVVLGLSVAGANLAAAVDTPSPNLPIPKTPCDSNITVSIRYAETTKRLYLESADNVTRGGCVTLGDIWEYRAGKAPLYAVDPVSGDVSANATGTWLLTEELYVEDGITLQVSSAAKGGRLCMRSVSCTYGSTFRSVAVSGTRFSSAMPAEVYLLAVNPHAHHAQLRALPYAADFRSPFNWPLSCVLYFELVACFFCLMHRSCWAAQVYGNGSGGDADELRLLSTNETFINLRAHGGNLDFVNTSVGTHLSAATVPNGQNNENKTE